MNGMGYAMNNQTPFQGMGWQNQADYSQMMPFGMPQAGGMLPFQNQMGMSTSKVLYATSFDRR
jgi:hypothetical protein